MTARPFSRASRQQRTVQFALRQRRQRKWIAFRDIADWCARENGSIEADEAKREKSYRTLAASILAADFERDGRSRVLLLNPEDQFCTLATHEAGRIVGSFGGDFDILTKAYLQWCWVPRDLAIRWFENRNLQLPPWLGTTPMPAARLAAAPDEQGSFSLPKTKTVAKDRLLRWYSDRVGAWPADRTPPSAQQDWEAAKVAHPANCVPRQMVRDLRRELAPAHWKMQGRPKLAEKLAAGK